MGNASSKPPDGFQFLMLKFLVAGPLQIGDVGTMHNVTRELTVLSEMRNPTAQHPTIFAILAPQAYFHLEISARVEGQVMRDNSFAILRVHVVGPPAAQFLVQGAASEQEPSLV